MTYLDYEESDLECPHCGHSPTRWQHCDVVGCDDGWIDLYEYDDPINFSLGKVEQCTTCRGTGIVQWCPECGKDIYLQCGNSR